MVRFRVRFRLCLVLNLISVFRLLSFSSSFFGFVLMLFPSLFSFSSSVLIFTFTLIFWRCFHYATFFYLFSFCRSQHYFRFCVSFLFCISFLIVRFRSRFCFHFHHCSHSRFSFSCYFFHYRPHSRFSFSHGRSARRCSVSGRMARRLPAGSILPPLVSCPDTCSSPKRW